MAHGTTDPTTREARAPEPAKPVLASEALQEDLAPLYPAQETGRRILGGAALALALLGVAMRLGPDPTAASPVDSASVCFALSGALAALALLPFSYGVRAGAGVVLGVTAMALGVEGAGPLAGIRADGPLRDLARLVAMSTLPAALLFRASYRAYTPARLLLGLALVTSIPFLVVEGYRAADAAAPYLSRALGVVDILAVLCGLFGFMGRDTTGGGSVWAALVLAVLSASFGLRALSPAAGATSWLLYPATACGLLAVTTVATLSIYQLLAVALAVDARRASVRMTRKAAPVPAEVESS